MRDTLIGAESLLTQEPFGRFLPAAYEINFKLHVLKNHQRSDFGLRGSFRSFAASTNRAIACLPGTPYRWTRLLSRAFLH
jgi:hypothetical protein